MANSTCFRSWKKEQIFDLGKCIIGWDELQDEMDSRGFKETNSRYYTRWVAKVRHKQAMLFYTCQEISDVDRRVRNNTDFVWLPEYDPIRDRIDITVIDWHRMELRRSICIQPASVAWKFYNTFEDVMPIEDFLPKPFTPREPGRPSLKDRWKRAHALTPSGEASPYDE